MQILTMFISIYTISVVIITVKKKREGAFVFLLGYIIFMFTIFNDFLHNIKIINTGYYSVVGIFFFIFSQAYILSKKSSLALTRVEELTESLEKKVLQRTEELSKERDRLIGANLQIEKLSESRKRLSIIGQMASGIVHDIKNPMSTIKSFAELVRGGNLSNIEKEEYLSYISREIDRLSDMTYEILDFSKGNIQLFIQNESISKILNEVYEFLKIDFDHSQISLQLEIQEDFILDFDRDRVRRVIFNLANNAKEEMSDGVKEYSFKIKAYTEDSFGIVSFTDNGHGVREEVKPKIFEAYSSEGKEYGIGLGLFMCKQIIDAHNGYITFDSKQGQGTVFYIKLPLSENK
jgi:signal transduction histidine kinase